jgi:hypothetical protein
MIKNAIQGYWCRKYNKEYWYKNNGVRTNGIFLDYTDIVTLCGKYHIRDLGSSNFALRVLRARLLGVSKEESLRSENPFPIPYFLFVVFLF